MRIPGLLLALVPAVLLVSVGAHAQTVRHSFRLEAVVRSSGGEGSSSSKTKVGSGLASAKDMTRTQERESSVGLEVQVRNMGQVQDKATLEWYFYAKPVAGGDDLFVFDQGTRELTLDPGSTDKLTVSSKELTSTVSRRVAPSGTGKTVKAPKTT